MLFPVLMGDDLASKCPMTICTTKEFDTYKRDTLQYADLMRKHGKLLMEPWVQPGTTHFSTLEGGPSIEGAKEHFDIQR